jgi:hypothetical protein
LIRGKFRVEHEDMAVNRDGQRTDEENASAGDPNLVGPQKTQGVADNRAGKMTSCWEYTQEEEFHGRKNWPEG